MKGGGRWINQDLSRAGGEDGERAEEKQAAMYRDAATG